MTPQQVLVYAYLALVSIGPLALYLCWIASLNKKSHPTIISGVWDFVLLLFGLSGVILVAGMLFVSLPGPGARYLQRANFADIEADWQMNHSVWIVMSLAYLFVVFGLFGYTLARRRGSLSIYQVEMEDVDSAIQASLQECGLATVRQGNQWLDGNIELKYFHEAYHATVWFRCQPPLRDELVRSFRYRIKKTEAGENAVGSWMTSVAAATTVLTVVLMGLLIFTKFYR